MGESKKDALRVNFDRKLKVEFHGTKVTSDAGLLAYRELDEVLELTTMIESELTDSRTGKNTQHGPLALLRQSVYSRLAGYDDTNDAERMSVDPAMRQVVGERAKERTAASTSLMGRFETEILTQPKNMELLKNLSGQWVDKVRQRKPLKQIVLDMDSSVSPTYGNQEGTAYNGYFQCTCYHPLFCFNQFGDMEQASLRNGNVHSADDWQSVLEPIAGFADPEIYRFLESEDYSYVIRLKGNNILQKHIEHLLTRPVGRPPNKPIVVYHSFRYRAASWSIDRRVVAKIEWHAGELFPRIMACRRIVSKNRIHCYKSPLETH
jgi:hypothetical protein